MADSHDTISRTSSIRTYDWTIADKATPPFCAVYKTENDEIVESRPWSKAAETWAETRAAELNANATLSSTEPTKPTLALKARSCFQPIIGRHSIRPSCTCSMSARASSLTSRSKRLPQRAPISDFQPPDRGS